MNYKIFISIWLCFFLFGCEQQINKKSKVFKFEEKYKNSGFALV